MKDKIRSLLGVEMSIGNLEFKPIVLLIGILLFIALSIPLLLVYCYLFIKNTLYNNWNEIKEKNKYNKSNSLRGV
jgi:uncharacterized membrane protein YjfL (UPF0719 family)